MPFDCHASCSAILFLAACVLSPDNRLAECHRRRPKYPRLPQRRRPGQLSGHLFTAALARSWPRLQAPPSWLDVPCVMPQQVHEVASAGTGCVRYSALARCCSCACRALHAPVLAARCMGQAMSVLAIIFVCRIEVPLKSIALCCARRWKISCPL